MTGKRIFTNDENNLRLTISEDGTAVYLTITEADVMIDEDEIIALLNTAGVKHGIPEAAEYMKRNKQKKKVGKPFLVAKAEMPESSVDISALFNVSNCYNPDTFESIYGLHEQETIRKGQPLADIRFTSPGEIGKTINVYGEEIEVSIGNSAPGAERYLGENVYFFPEKGQILASQSGYPYIDEDEKINVKSKFEINEDIHGAVLNLMASLMVNGSINSSILEIDGDLTVTGTITECRDGILVNGDVSFSYAEHSKIISKGGITFDKKVQDCQLLANGPIQGGPDSSLVGGLGQSGKNVEVAILGSPFAIFTEVGITVDPFLKARMLKLSKQLDAAKRKYESDSGEVLELVSQLSNLESEYEKRLEAYMAGEKSEFQISAKNKIYPGLHLRVLSKTTVVEKELAASTYFINNSQLQTNEG